MYDRQELQGIGSLSDGILYNDRPTNCRIGPHVKLLARGVKGLGRLVEMFGK